MPRFRFAVFAVAMLTGLAFAQPAWSVQIAAFRDFRDASATVTQLESRGYDAYSEFTMQDGKQYARVRVGCFLDRQLAEGVSASLRDAADRDSVYGDAAVVPFTPGAAAATCVAGTIGFRLPERWGVASSEPLGILFWVELAGRRGYLAFDGAAWHVIQNQEEAERFPAGLSASTHPPPSSPSARGFGAAVADSFTAGPHDALQVQVDGRQFVAGYGKLLWRSQRTAVLQTSDTITAIALSAAPK